MRILREKAAVRDFVSEARAAGKTIGFVPTMGALHEGHLSLVRAAADSCDVVVVSVFVNPTQFGPHEDFDRYPRTLDADVALLEPAGVAAVFAPSVEEMYGAALRESAGVSPTRTSVTPGPVARRWEGELRPGHFAGVALVVTKLLSAVRPDRAFFGEKDYQQLCVIRQLNDDLDLGVEIVGCPILRESDGLALSSRNRYLTPAARALAPNLYRCIELARTLYGEGELGAREIEQWLTTNLSAIRGEAGESFSIGYVAIVDPLTLEPLNVVGGDARLLLSVELDGTHLIDNGSLTERDSVDEPAAVQVTM